MKSAIILASTASLASVLAQLKPAVGAQLTSANRVDESSRGKRAQDICVETEGKVLKKQASFDEWAQVCQTEGLCKALETEPLLWETIPELAGWAIGNACPIANQKRSVDETSRGKRSANRCVEIELGVLKGEVSFQDWRHVCKTEGLCNVLHTEPLIYENIPELVGWAISKTCHPDLPDPEPVQYSCLETEGRVLKKIATFEEWAQVCKQEGLCSSLHSEPLLYENIPELAGWAIAQACPLKNGV